MTGTPRSPRARFREQTRAEIKDAALQQLAEGGTSAVALIRIAKSLGMSGPALYRYFDSRDALLTELVRDAYDDLTAAVRHAASGIRAQATPRSRLHTLVDAYRTWAVAQPHRYLLIQGTPVPGCTAAPDTTDRARAAMTPFLAAFGAAEPTGSVQPVVDQVTAWTRQDPAVAAWAAEHSPSPGTALAGVVLAWSHMHGAVSLEVSGQCSGMGHTGDTLLAAQIDTLADAFRLA
ncbi:TetR/AcrR family transcriptional regulator [Streptomyces sp. NPDC006208]|uniref:TetR/AcrR family transcriptional regulator n=1 Tax=Streptomyces sp. NPDC006208 TaxID=3156734 RepID=UPI0033B01B00